MKKVLQIVIFAIFVIAVGYFGFNYKTVKTASSLYKVYLNGEVIGIIESKKELEDYIDSRSDEYKKTFGVDQVYAPNGIQINKMETYSDSVDSVEYIYNIIAKKAPFTISGYEWNIKSDDKVITVYTLSKEIFDEAIDNTFSTFVGADKYESYKNETQAEIDTTGEIIEDVYVGNTITVKKTNISVEETIYTESSDLAKFFLFGTTETKKTYTVKIGDDISSVSFNNGISVEEFLISNPGFTSSKNLLFPGQEVIIGITDPQISVVVVEYAIEDKEVAYAQEYQYDENKSTSEETVLQTGENGLERVTQRTTVVNGVINSVDPIAKEVLSPVINEIIEKGKKVVSGVGSAYNWLWPTNGGWTITSDYAYRINPFSGYRELHAAIDIAGTGSGSPIYAVTNGVVYFSEYQYEAGNYICINHNVNNYYTCYAHLIKRLVVKDQVVERGDIIGYMGMTGSATGVHLHFEVWIGKPWMGGYRISPWLKY